MIRQPLTVQFQFQLSPGTVTGAEALGMPSDDSLTLESAATLIVGPFHPSVITPEWLIEQNVCSQDADWLVHPASKGIAFSMRESQPTQASASPTASETYWEVDYESLLIGSDAADCGALAATIIELHRHVPIVAVSHKFDYSVSKSLWPETFLPNVGGLQRSDWVKLMREKNDSIDAQYRWTGTFFDKDAYVIEQSIAEAEDKILISTNYSYRAASAAMVIETAKLFLQIKADSAAMWNNVLTGGEKKS